MAQTATPPAAVQGEQVSREHARFAEILHSYDSRFTLEYVPERDRQGATLDELMKPFRIVEVSPALGRQVVRYLTAKEMERPDQILAWLWAGDLSKHRPDEVINRIELEERARRMMDLSRQRDEAQERQDHMAFLVSGGRNKKNFIRLDRNRSVERR